MHEISNGSSDVAELRKEILLLKAELEESRKVETTEKENLTDVNESSKESDTQDLSDNNDTVPNEHKDFRGVITQDALKEELEKYVQSIRQKDEAEIQLLSKQNFN